MTQTISFEPEVLFPQKSEVGRQIIRAYREHAPEIKYAGHLVPGIDNSTTRLSNVKLPYQWETSGVEVTPDLSKILELDMQTPLLIDGERIALFEKLKNSGFDGKVHGYYTVGLDRAIKGDCNNPSRRFSFSSSGNPSMSLEYPITENKGLHGVKVELRVYKDWDKTQIGENEFKFLDVVHDFSISRKREHFLSFCDKLYDARGRGDTGQLTMFIEKMSELKTLGEYVPEEFRNDRMEKAKETVNFPMFYTQLNLMASQAAFMQNDKPSKCQKQLAERLWNNFSQSRRHKTTRELIQSKELKEHPELFGNENFLEDFVFKKHHGWNFSL
jgi:hypothetical protein